MSYKFNSFGPDLRRADTLERKGFHSPMIKGAEKNGFTLRGNCGSQELTPHKEEKADLCVAPYKVVNVLYLIYKWLRILPSGQKILHGILVEK